MRASLDRYRIEVVLALVAAFAVYYGVQGLLALQEARADYEAAVERQQDLRDEAAQYDVAALTAERDRLKETPAGSVFPSRDEVETHIGTIANLLNESSVELGPIVMGEISDEVTDEDIGASGDGERTYDGIEMSLSISGAVFDLLDLAERLLAAVPDATLRDVTLTLPGAAGERASLAMSVLLYYED